MMRAHDVIVLVLLLALLLVEASSLICPPPSSHPRRPSSASRKTNSNSITKEKITQMNIQSHDDDEDDGMTAATTAGPSSSRRAFLGSVVAMTATGVLTTTTTPPAAAAAVVADPSKAAQCPPPHGIAASASERRFSSDIAASAPSSSFSSSSPTTTITTTTIVASAATVSASPPPPPPAAAAVVIDWNGIAQKAGKRALGGGKAGAAAAVVQVSSLMWLRTSMNYQYRYGGNLTSSLRALWEQGGVARLYQGLPFALVQGPLTRFGDTAANVGILALLGSLEATRDLPLPLMTACGSAAAGAWRILLMPVDASKTAMQVEGADGLERLWQSVADRGPGPLYRGALAQAAATTAGHYPWFLVYNALNERLPEVAANQDDLLLSLGRAALIGLSASCVSDCVSNPLRVIKTTKQTAQLGTGSLTDDDDDAGRDRDLSYAEVVSMILEKDGVAGLFGRGLQTRLLTNAIQGAIFSVCWKYFQTVGV